jgi:hypothetical protein
MVIVLVGTLAQTSLGIHAAQEQYFRSWIIFAELPNGLRLPVMPGGFLIGWVLLANLIAAHVGRFRLSWKKAGIVAIHAGIILLLLGELFTALFSVESQMRLDEGETKAYSEAFRGTELVLIDISDPQIDRVVSVPEDLLARRPLIEHETLPFTVRVDRFMGNTRFFRREPGTPPAPGVLTVPNGLGAELFASEIRRTGKPDERDLSTAIVTLLGRNGESLGQWMLCNAFMQPQQVTYDGRTWDLELRMQRFYKPFTISLIKFSHDRYPGTEIPKNFSSLIRLKDPERREDRESLIYMNNPLRYAGLTFYQAGFDNNDTTTILQVVRNPSWLLPYIACLVVTLGLCAQFGYHLFQFVQRRKSS